MGSPGWSECQPFGGCHPPCGWKRKSEKVAELLQCQPNIREDGFEGFPLDCGPRVYGDNSSSPVRGSPINGMARPCLARKLKAYMGDDSDDLPGSDDREPLGHLNGDPDGRDGDLDRFRDGLVMGLEILKVGINDGLHLVQGALKLLSLDMAPRE